MQGEGGQRRQKETSTLGGTLATQRAMMLAQRIERLRPVVRINLCVTGRMIVVAALSTRKFWNIGGVLLFLSYRAYSA